MFKNSLKGLFFLFLIVFVYGCASSGAPLEVRSYMDDKQRVDQDFDGNSGYLVGTPSEPGPRKPTRRIYVLEVSKAAELDEEKTTETSVTTTTQESSSVEDDSSSVRSSQDSPSFTTNVSPKINIPAFDQDSSVSSGSGKTVEYVVDKDDTLQKISKKFYNTYSKWNKIYQANKEKIKNPDRIQPGITITIPLE